VHRNEENGLGFPFVTLTHASSFISQTFGALSIRLYSAGIHIPLSIPQFEKSRADDSL
jgi:hypothetical protein